jgi:hypothetical protein
VHTRRVAERFREPDGGLAWLDPVHVACPRCSRRATVRGGRDQGSGHWTARLVCAHCVLARNWSGGQPVEPRDGRDPRFDVPLWLRTECCGGHLLWATNGAHLQYLELYVGARLRERPPPPSGLAWRLPAWLEAAGHRDDVLRALGRLRATLD